MKPLKSLYFIAIAYLGLSLSACQIEQLVNPNAPSITLVENASLSELQNLLSGSESGMRNGLNTTFSDLGVVGREYYRFSNSDPRFASDLLGQGTGVLSNTGFYITIPFADRYQVVKNINLLLEAVEKTKADLSADQKAYYKAVASTYQAHELLMVLNLMYNNGIRTDVSDPDNLGPFKNLTESLSAIKGLLDQAATDLKSGTESNFIFKLSPGLAGFNTPATFYQFNRALAARVAVYQGNWDEALNVLDDSFLNLGGDLTTGAYYYFSKAGNDLVNPVYYAPDATGEIFIVHPSYIADAEAGDNRIANQVHLRKNTASQSGLSGDYDMNVYKGLDSPIPIIRNAELILIYAEAKIQNNAFSDAVAALNIIRNAAGLPDYSGTMDQPSLINEMLKQRRYELYAEGHRWIDMRRYNRLGDLPIDRPGDDVWEQFPIPLTDVPK